MFGLSLQNALATVYNRHFFVGKEPLVPESTGLRSYCVLTTVLWEACSLAADYTCTTLHAYVRSKCLYVVHLVRFIVPIILISFYPPPPPLPLLSRICNLGRWPHREHRRCAERARDGKVHGADKGTTTTSVPKYISLHFSSPDSELAFFLPPAWPGLTSAHGPPKARVSTLHVCWPVAC